MNSEILCCSSLNSTLRSSRRFWLEFQSSLLRVLSPRLIALIESMAQGNFSLRTSSNGHWSGAWSSTFGWGMRSIKGVGPIRNQRSSLIDLSIQLGARYFLWHLNVAGKYNLFNVSCYRRYSFARTGELSDVGSTASLHWRLRCLLSEWRQGMDQNIASSSHGA